MILIWSNVNDINNIDEKDSYNNSRDFSIAENLDNKRLTTVQKIWKIEDIE